MTTPEHDPVAPVETLAARLQRLHDEQSQRLLDLGFANLLGMTKEAYRASLPRFANLPEGLVPTRTPLIVDPRIPLENQLKAAKIAPLPGLSLDVWDPIIGFTSPGPYAVFLGQPEKPVAAPLEGITLAELVAFTTQYEEDLPVGHTYAWASRFDDGKIPAISKKGSKRTLVAYSADRITQARQPSIIVRQRQFIAA